MNSVVKKTKIFICTFLVVISLAISTPNTTNAAGGGAGITVIATLLGIALIAKHFIPGDQLILQGKDMSRINNTVVFNYYLGMSWLIPTINSVSTMTVYTQELRFLLALQYYMSMYRYLLVKREITNALTPPATVGHPNALTNHAAIEVLTQYDIATGGEVRKAIKQYKQIQNIFSHAKSYYAL